MQLKLGYSQNAKDFVSALQTQSVILSLEVILIMSHDRDFLATLLSYSFGNFSKYSILQILGL